VFAQQLPGLGIEQADIQVIPLHPDPAPDPAWRCAVVSGFEGFQVLDVVTPGGDSAKLRSSLLSLAGL
jgi:hypothetical protein